MYKGDAIDHWSNPSTYSMQEIVTKQHKQGTYNYGDYVGEMTLDFEFLRPPDDDEEADDNKEEESEVLEKQTKVAENRGNLLLGNKK